MPFEESPTTMPPSANTPSSPWRRTALLLALLCLILDQASKWALLEMVGMPERGLIEITPFFNLVMVWNTGVSFGMMAGDNAAWRWGMIGFTLLVCAVLTVWLLRTPHRLVALGLGCVLGGALGNIIDRIRFGAVADFFDFHIAGWHWPAFNIADSCIFLGACLLILDGFLAKDDAQEGAATPCSTESTPGDAP